MVGKNGFWNFDGFAIVTFTYKTFGGVYFQNNFRSICRNRWSSEFQVKMREINRMTTG
jgi:hypothetical protein